VYVFLRPLQRPCIHPDGGTPRVTVQVREGLSGAGKVSMQAV